MTRRGRAVVVGAGVIGTACAYFLRAAGWEVTLLERGSRGEGCSYGNCGFVCPSHVRPLTEPGAVWRTMQAMCRRNSPFYIRPRLDPSLWRWLLGFARRCNHAHVMSGALARAPLLKSSLATYQELVTGGELECEWQRAGLLFVYRTPAALDHYASVDGWLRKHFGIGARRLDGEELVLFEPALQVGLAGGWYYSTDAHLRPDKLLNSWHASLERRGVTIIEECAAEGLECDAAQAVAVATTRGRIPGDAFVVAAGALTPQWNRQLGCRIPVQPGKGYSLTMPRPAICPRVPMIFEEHRVAVTPMQSGYRLGSTMEFSGYDTSLPPRRLQLLRDGARLYLREPYCEPVEWSWYGWRPMCVDDVPIIDRAPVASNVVVATGHGMVGVSTAPATGRLVAEILSEQTPHVDPEPYRLARFR